MPPVLLKDPDANTDTRPVMFIDRKNQVNTTCVGAITAYVYDTSNLNLEEAARVASVCDQQVADNLLVDFVGNENVLFTLQ